MKYLVILFVSAAMLVTVCMASSEWKEIHVEDGGYVIDFPSPPLPTTTTVDTAVGKAFFYVVSLDYGDTAFFSSYHVLPPGSVVPDREILDYELNRGLAGSSASLVWDKPFTGDRYDGREFLAEKGKFRYRGRHFIIGDQVHSLVVIGFRDSEIDEQAQRFFESFKSSMQERSSLDGQEP